MNSTKISGEENNSKSAETITTSTVPNWLTETINGGSLPHVDLNTGTNGWASPPGDSFSLRSVDYFTNKQKSPGVDYLLSPAGVDWLKSTTKLDNILSRPDNRITHALKKAQSRGESLNSFIFAVNFQIPSKEPHSLVIYFATEDPIPPDSILHRLINGDDSFINQRFKCVSEVVKGPWIVKASIGNFGAFVVGKSTKCSFYRGSNYFEIDVDISSSPILTTFVRFMFGYITNLTVDVGFVIEAQTAEELPERLIGAVRICHLELSSAFVVDDLEPLRMMGAAEENHGEDDTVTD